MKKLGKELEFISWIDDNGRTTPINKSFHYSEHFEFKLIPFKNEFYSTDFQNEFYIVKLKPDVLLTTEDGVDIRYGDDVWYYHRGYVIPSKQDWNYVDKKSPFSMDIKLGFKFFSSEQSAKDYIKSLKPQPEPTFKLSEIRDKIEPFERMIYQIEINKNLMGYNYIRKLINQCKESIQYFENLK